MSSFHPLEVMGRGTETEQMDENVINLIQQFRVSPLVVLY